jgi:hypothetical protein
MKNVINTSRCSKQSPPYLHIWQPDAGKLDYPAQQLSQQKISESDQDPICLIALALKVRTHNLKIK